MKYLFLCSVGKNRSPTAASVARDIAKERGLDIEVFYGGFDNLPKDISDEQLKENFEQYDLLVVMEDVITRGLVRLGVPKKKIRCLEIPDEYQRDDPVLVNILKRSLELYVRQEPL